MVVMITSGYALLPATRAPTYSATKAGLHSFTIALRRQLRGAGVRIVEVMPPLIDTPATRAVLQPKMAPAVLVSRVLRDIARGPTGADLGAIVSAGDHQRSQLSVVSCPRNHLDLLLTG